LCYSINAVRSLGVKHTAMMLLTVKFSKPEQDILSELYQKSLVYEAFLQSATQMANGTTNSEPVYTFSFEHKHQWILHCTAGLIEKCTVEDTTRLRWMLTLPFMAAMYNYGEHKLAKYFRLLLELLVSMTSIDCFVGNKIENAHYNCLVKSASDEDKLRVLFRQDTSNQQVGARETVAIRIDEDDKIRMCIVRRLGKLFAAMIMIDEKYNFFISDTNLEGALEEMPDAIKSALQKSAH
jgi:hypothetical protein